MSVLKFFDLPPVWTILSMAVAWFMASVWAPLGDWSVWPGGALIIAGLGLTVWAAAHLVRHKTTVIPGGDPTTLVTDGPFAFSRNPIYLADMIILTGWSIACGTLAGLLMLIFLYDILQKRFILPEEARLRASFGDAFDAYAANVRRWI